MHQILLINLQPLYGQLDWLEFKLKWYLEDFITYLDHPTLPKTKQLCCKIKNYLMNILTDMNSKVSLYVSINQISRIHTFQSSDVTSLLLGTSVPPFWMQCLRTSWLGEAELSLMSHMRAVLSPDLKFISIGIYSSVKYSKKLIVTWTVTSI